MRSFLLGAIGACSLVLTVALTGCSKPPAGADPLPRVLTVRAGSIDAPADAPAAVSARAPEAVSAAARETDQIFPATLLARHEVSLGFRAGGRVLTRRIEVGSRVSADQVLGTLDVADYQLNAALAADQRRAAEIELAQAERDAARFGRLGGEGAMPTAEQERQRARADATAQKVQEAGHQMALAERRVAYTELRAPFAGVVTQVQFEPGLVLPEGQAVLTLADPAQQEVVADLPEQLAMRIRQVQLLAGLPGQPGALVPLQVRELAPQANPLGRTVRVRLTPVGAPSAARQALQGLGRSVDLHVRDVAPAGAAGALALPAAALVQTSGAPFVYVAEPAREGAPGTAVLRIQPVQVASYDAVLVHVRGVPVGARVVAAGVQKLHAGLQVTALERTGNGLDWTLPQ